MKAIESWTCKMFRFLSHDAACCSLHVTLIQQHRRPLPWLHRLYLNIARAANHPSAYNTYRPQQAPSSCQRDAFRHVSRDIKRGLRLISVGVQSAVFHRRESECDKNRGPPAEALHRRCCRWTPVSPVLICKENPLS